MVNRLVLTVAITLAACVAQDIWATSKTRAKLYAQRTQ